MRNIIRYIQGLSKRYFFPIASEARGTGKEGIGGGEGGEVNRAFEELETLNLAAHHHATTNQNNLYVREEHSPN